MKKLLLASLLALPLAASADNEKVIAQTEGSITFVVDENLEAIPDKYRLLSGVDVAKGLLSERRIKRKDYNIVATSFDDAQCIGGIRKDAFYYSVVDAYAKHKSLTLSPDMMWLLVSQGFARYVNAHAEKLRSQLVSHSGKMKLAIEAPEDLLTGDPNWPELIDGFASQIDQYTKDGIAKTLTADFSTTSPAERVVSQITLMESVKSYFDYVLIISACGIPTITLKGTPADWRQVLEKTKRLEKYGLGKWTKSLEPILAEFVSTAEGQPNQSFWQDILKKNRTEELKKSGCGRNEPTRFDGWILKFFPDENGQTLEEINYEKEMPEEQVSVGFKYQVKDPVKDSVVSEIPMELWAGFIGTEVDTLTNTYTPKIGWFVRKSRSDEDLLNELRREDQEYGIDLTVDEVPEILSRLDHIKRLRLVFTGDVKLPDWFFKLKIDSLSIDGKMTKKQKARLEKHFSEALKKKPLLFNEEDMIW